MHSLANVSMLTGETKMPNRVDITVYVLKISMLALLHVSMQLKVLLCIEPHRAASMHVDSFYTV